MCLDQLPCNKTDIVLFLISSTINISSFTLLFSWCRSRKHFQSRYIQMMNKLQHALILTSQMMDFTELTERQLFLMFHNNRMHLENA